VNGQVEDPAALPAWKETPITIGYEIGWTMWRRENSWPSQNSNSNPSVVQAAIIHNIFLFWDRQHGYYWNQLFINEVGITNWAQMCWVLQTLINKCSIGFEVVTEVGLKSYIFWDITPCSLLKVNWAAFYLISRWFLAWIIVLPWKWGRNIHPERRLALAFSGIHGIISQKI
jgi:hypothetical protein